MWRRMKIQEIYERQGSRVYRIAMLYLKNVSDAEDIVQNIFVKYMERPVEFADGEHEKAWFITAARNECRDVLRNFWRRRVDLGAAAEPAAAADGAADLLPYLMELPAKYREVLYLHYYEGYSLRELSVILGRKESTLQTQAANGRKKLRRMLEGREA